jgi:hypothetical protein
MMERASITEREWVAGGEQREVGGGRSRELKERGGVSEGRTDIGLWREKIVRGRVVGAPGESR